MNLSRLSPLLLPLDLNKIQREWRRFRWLILHSSVVIVFFLFCNIIIVLIIALHALVAMHVLMLLPYYFTLSERRRRRRLVNGDSTRGERTEWNRGDLPARIKSPHALRNNRESFQSCLCFRGVCTRRVPLLLLPLSSLFFFLY